jgi:hypothetical protein
MTLGASSDHGGGCLVSGDVLIWDTPMLLTPCAGVGGVDREQADAVAVGPPGQAVTKYRRRDTGHCSAEAFAARSSAHRFPTRGAGVSEVEVLHRHVVDAVAAGVVHEPGDRVPNLRIPTRRTSREVDLDALGPADWVAVPIQAAHGEVAVVEIHTHDRAARTDFGVWVRRVEKFESRWPACP